MTKNKSGIQSQQWKAEKKDISEIEKILISKIQHGERHIMEVKKCQAESKRVSSIKQLLSETKNDDI